MENKQEDVDSLLEYLHGELDKAQQDEIKKRITEDPETRLLFDALRRTHLRARWGTRVQLIRSDFSSIQKQIIPYSKWKIYACTTAAAAVVLFICLSILFLNETSTYTPQFSRSSSEIQPGKSQALLTLSDGTSIPIETGTKDIHEQNGIHIQIKPNGVIEYPKTSPTDSAQTAPALNSITTPRGGEFRVILADGTKIWMNADTRLEYPIHFQGDKREVYLKGEAYFEVTKDATKPFLVHLDEINVQVFGTEFYVNSRDSNLIQAVLVSGSVGMSKGKQQVMLLPNQKADYRKDLNKIFVTNTDVTPYVGWKDGNFVFYDESLESIMNKLSLWYDMDVFYTSSKIRDIRLSGDMKKYDNIEKLLYFFEQISEVKFTIKGKCLTIDYK